MPARIVCPVSSSVLTWKVGSSSASRWIAAPSRCWSLLVFGSAAARGARPPVFPTALAVKGGAFLGEPLDRGAEPLLVALGLRLDSDADHRRRERHGLQDHRLSQVTQRVTGGGVLETHHRDDLPSHRGRTLLALVRVHLVDLADPLLAALDRVENGGAGLQSARVDPDVGELAEVLVRHDLEGKRRERLRRVGVPLDYRLLVA